MSIPSPPPSQATSESGAKAEPPKRLFGAALPRVALSLLLGGGFLWLLLRGGLPLLPSKEALSRVPWLAVAAYALFVCGSIGVRALRWHYLIRPIAPDAPRLRVMGICMVGFSAIFLAPLRTGEVVRPYLISRDGQVTFMQAAGTVGAERVIDGLLLTLFTFVALATAQTVSPLPSSLGDLPLPVSAVPAAVYSALILFTGAFAVMTAFYVARETASRVTRRVVGLVSARAANWAAGTLERLADGLSFLPSRQNLLLFLRESCVYWALSILGQWLLLRAFGLPATFAQATTSVGVQGLGSLVPAGPGMFGAYQIAGFSALAMFFPMAAVKSAGAVFIFITYTTQLALNGLQLLVGYWLMTRAKARVAAAS